jgi:hypothetical protein
MGLRELERMVASLEHERFAKRGVGRYVERLRS